MYGELIAADQRISGNETKDFSRGTSPYLFNLLLDVLARDIQNIIANCIYFLDDIVFIEKSWEALKLEFWRQTLKTRNFHLKKNKIKYIRYNFSRGMWLDERFDL